MYLVTENEYELRSNEKDVTLTALEGEKIIENSKIIIKLLKKAQFNYQIELSRGTHRKKEEILYTKIEGMDDMIKTIESMEKGMVEYQKKLSDEEKKKK